MGIFLIAVRIKYLWCPWGDRNILDAAYCADFMMGVY